MPNYCYYTMKVKGKEKDIKDFINIMQADYNYENGTTEKVHFCRVFNADTNGIEGPKDDPYAIIRGYCAWSVYSCMMSDPHTYSYYNDCEKEYGDNSKATTLDCEARHKNLTIEVFSKEDGVGFQEHFIVDETGYLVDDCHNYQSIYVDNWDTFDEMNEELGTSYTEEDIDPDNKYSIIVDSMDGWGVFTI